MSELISVETFFTGSEQDAREFVLEWNVMLCTTTFRARPTEEEDVYKITGRVTSEEVIEYRMEEDFIVGSP
jgi:hypothetical protein